MARKKPPPCPRCSARPVRTATRYGDRYDCCGLWAWGPHPLVSRETHEARQRAHAAFDPLWMSGRIRRGDAYAMLQQELGLSAQDCHMKKMTAEMAARVPAAAQNIRRAMEGQGND